MKEVVYRRVTSQIGLGAHITGAVFQEVISPTLFLLESSESGDGLIYMMLGVATFYGGTAVKTSADISLGIRTCPGNFHPHLGM